MIYSLLSITVDQQVRFLADCKERMQPSIMSKSRKIDILGVKVDDISPKTAVERILAMALDPKGSHYVVTVNPEFVMLARRNRQFAKILAKADLAVADGWGVVWAKLLFGGKEKNRLAGVDLVEKLCSKSAKKAVKVGFLGGFDKVAEIVANRQKAKNKELRILFAGPGDPTRGYDLKLRNQLETVGRIDILFVAFGMGQQEFWIARNRQKLNGGVLIGVGGAFDYLAGVKKRAPGFIQKAGLEWLWRLFCEPARIRRMLVLPIFAFLVLKKWFFKKFSQ